MVVRQARQSARCQYPTPIQLSNSKPIPSKWATLRKPSFSCNRSLCGLGKAMRATAVANRFCLSQPRGRRRRILYAPVRARAEPIPAPAPPLRIAAQNVLQRLA